MAASMRNPVVVILGATGTGKTKLSLELAKLFNGEIISADAMQLYKGLDIITNKATQEERATCRHHMIDFLSPLKEDNTVVHYRDQAVPIIDSLLQQKKSPVIVGGTNYYIEALLWKHLVNKEDVKRAAAQTRSTASKFPKLQGVKKFSGELGQSDVALNALQDESNCDNNTNTPASSSFSSDDKIDGNDDSDNDEDDFVTTSTKDAFKDVSSLELHQRLREIDPDTALKMHPNDRRKIIRAILVYKQHGIPMSEVYKAQRHEISGTAMSGPLRYRDCCIFWLQCDQDVLDKRLDDRVDKMLELGLLDELSKFHKQCNEYRIQQGSEADYTTGIFQSIGFKEFHDYLMLDEEKRETEEGKKALQKGIEDLKIATRRYARYQNRWVRKRLLKRPCREEVPPVYGLDCTDVSLWDDNVCKPATIILTALRKEETSPIPAIPYEDEHVQQYEYNECKYCNVTAVIQDIWQKHIGSRKHKNNVQRYKRQMAQLSQTLDTYVQQKKQEEEEPKP
ncbi:tRNA dimethylallyltransferase-like isoform X2 [Mercenaria mercenaria]|uniref:tRNA dimethylallyltransferase-like isoform X2 n=1 Tax=Mercenaria mercenaria TaxID=6596 RepID=UPI00234E8CB2|nr:tRNA dimethylallyltransferase-like isoform X2 [Mercenaria mercenaria]